MISEFPILKELNFIINRKTLSREFRTGVPCKLVGKTELMFFGHDLQTSNDSESILVVDVEKMLVASLFSVKDALIGCIKNVVSYDASNRNSTPTHVKRTVQVPLETQNILEKLKSNFLLFSSFMNIKGEIISLKVLKVLYIM